MDRRGFLRKLGAALAAVPVLRHLPGAKAAESLTEPLTYKPMGPPPADCWPVTPSNDKLLELARTHPPPPSWWKEEWDEEPVNCGGTLEELKQIRLETYQGFIHLDFAQGKLGTVYPAGTPFQPVNSWHAAHEIQDALDLPILVHRNDGWGYYRRVHTADGESLSYADYVHNETRP